MYVVIHHGLYGRIIERKVVETEAEALSLVRTISEHNFNGNSWVQVVGPMPLEDLPLCDRIIFDFDADRFLLSR